MPVMTAEELGVFFASVFPQSRPERFAVDAVGEGFVRVFYESDAEDLRPGNTVSGPTLMALSDTAMYLAVLASIGPVALAVTTSLNINFLRKPQAGRLVAEATILKLGKRLAVGEVFVRGEGAPEPVSHATVTYSIPPDR